jgi:ornithine cyclodeaminase/alanine dehydrogenase-like protein (mu-crystallin family)
MVRVIEREQIARVLSLEEALVCVERSFRFYSGGSVTAPPVAHLGFTDPPGDCHIKAAHIHGEPIFAVKVSNGFYENPSRGLPSSNGLVLVLSAECDTLITTTPSTEPLVESEWVTTGMHITAVGADAKGKQELDPELFGRARGILVDSREQCVDHAEVCHAVAAGIVKPDALVEIGEALAGQDWKFKPAGEMTIADLSGLGASDAMMAQAIWNALG